MEDSTIQWGNLHDKNSIEEALKSISSDKTIKSIKYTHLSKGFTDNVFLAKLASLDGTVDQFVIKEYIEKWHNREANTYKNLLGGPTNLGQPRLFFANSRFIILEYLDPLSYRCFGSSDLNLLKDWIIRKHELYRGSTLPLTKYAESYKVQYGYLIKRPFQTLTKLKGCAKTFGLNIETLDEILSIKEKLENYILELSTLPLTIEHGDLEPQNLLVDVSNNAGLRVLDWVNTRAGSGLFDINQYFESAEELGAVVNKESDLKLFAQFYSSNDFADLLRKSRVLMLMNKINFYGGKILLGIETSESKGVRNITLLNKFLNELHQLIRIS
jgi:hypothetical protein